MKTEEETREQVKSAYASAITQGGSCCGPFGDKEISKMAGYSKEELANVPEGAAGSSFGCGNPLAFSKVKKGQTVLDLGSGAGLDLLIAAEKVGENGQVIGVDMTDEMIAKARENVERAGVKNVEVRKGIIEELPVEDNSVDWVISNCVINLSPEKDKVFKEIYRVLKPGGQISISDIVANDLPDWVLQSAALYSSCVAGAVSEEQYIAGLEKAGLTDIRIDDRLAYGTAELKAMAGSNVPGADALMSCCGSVVDSALEQFEGKVQSLKFHGRKPK